MKPRALWAFALAAAPLGLSAAEPAPVPFGEVIDVRVVNVEVVVEDGAGDRVRALGIADFRLTVDGREVPIEYLTEVRGGEAVASPAGAGGGGIPALDEGGAVGRSFLVFIDDFFPFKHDRDRVLRQLISDLPLLGPADRMAVVSFDGRRLHLVTAWEQSVPALMRALEQAMLRPAHGIDRATERRLADRSRPSQPAGDSSLQSISRAARPGGSSLDYAETLASQVGRSVEAASAALRSFASPPGRKVMILLSGGWPYMPLDYAADRSGVHLPASDIPGGEELFRGLVNTANLLGYTLYPIDVPGLIGETIDVEQEAPVDLASLNLLRSEREPETQAALEHLAQETGGKAMLNGRRSEVFTAVAADTRSYYWLGFTPQWRGDGRTHRIEVNLRSPGLRVRSRESFQDLSREREVTMAVESALLSGVAPNAKPLAVELGKPVRAGRQTVRVPLRLSIPADGISLIPVGDKQVAALELRVAAVDEAGRRSDIPVIPVRIEGGMAAPAAGRFLPYQATVELRRSRQDLVVSLYDTASGQTLAAALEFNP